MAGEELSKVLKYRKSRFQEGKNRDSLAFHIPGELTPEHLKVKTKAFWFQLT